ncbi:unnamed protein product [Clonostachys rosea]|uniref:Wax synthase domain-containing protein n=1 Tax=Bionectria ochroleuca TaxID=29856 RepID=A0ABY6U2I5_BIOOC|nr:unnamed protein product [Clonostachys rosea]
MVSHMQVSDVAHPPWRNTTHNTMGQTKGDEDLYKLVSGFYGPGSIGCWYLLVISVLISWVFDPRCRFRVTKDLIAAVIYPTVAAGHLLIQIVNFPTSGVQYMIVNLLNLIWREYDGPVKLGEKSSRYLYPPDLASQERDEVYPLVASINSSLRVVDNFTYLALMVLICTWPKKNYAEAQLRHRLSLLLVVGGSLIWSWHAELVLLIKFYSSASYKRPHVFLLSFFKHLSVALWAFSWAVVLFLTTTGAKAAIKNILRIRRRHPAPLQDIHQHWAKWTKSMQEVRDGGNLPTILDVSKVLLRRALIFIAILAIVVTYLGIGVWYSIRFPTLLFFPPVSSSLMELDQAAALAGGLFNLGLTLHGIFSEGIYGRIWGAVIKYGGMLIRPVEPADPIVDVLDNL